MRLSQASTDALFQTWLFNFAALITAAPTTYGLVSGDAVAIQAQSDAFTAALALATDPSTRTPVTIADKDSAKSAALAVVRPYNLSITNNAGVADMDKTAVGATVRKLVPTPIPTPTDTAAISFVSAVPLNTTLQARNVLTPTSKAKPFGAIGVEVWDSVGTVAATDPAQLDYRFTATKIPFVRTFGAGDQGKICSMAVRYVTRGGLGGVAKVGPWSAILPFVIA